jgi:7-cyano-7-deazaguanine synthase in queuosine biosynthesis
METLIMFSGGLDSTHLLLKTLRTTDDAVHAHYIHYKSPEGRYEAEADAVAKIIPHIQYHNRGFLFSQNTMDLSEWHVSDMQVVRFMAGQICGTRPTIDRVFGSCIAEDLCPDYFDRLPRGEQMFELVLHGKKIPQWEYPQRSLTKADEIKYIREQLPDLLDMVHYCRRPQSFSNKWYNCGICKPCNEMKAADMEVYMRRLLS